jgi:hypothetical protein
MSLMVLKVPAWAKPAVPATSEADRTAAEKTLLKVVMASFP